VAANVPFEMIILRRPREASIERRVVRDARIQYGLRGLKLTLRYDAAWPDRLWILPNGRVLWMEFKAPGKGPDPLQANRHAELRSKGHEVVVLDNYETAMFLLGERCCGR
jgi:hypothetical protein